MLAYMGYKTERDLSKFGNVLMAALLMALIVTVVNFIIGSSTLDIVFRLGNIRNIRRTYSL